MKATLRDIVLAVRYGDAALVGESAGYLVLGAADRALSSSRHCHLDSVAVNADGDIELDAVSCSPEDAELSLRSLLGTLLKEARTPCPNLTRVAERTTVRGMRDFVTELEVALVPVNRKAAKRSLCRLAREAVRSRESERHSLQVQAISEQIVASEPAQEIWGSADDSDAQPAQQGAPLPRFEEADEFEVSVEVEFEDDALTRVLPGLEDDSELTRVMAQVSAAQSPVVDTRLYRVDVPAADSPHRGIFEPLIDQEAFIVESDDDSRTLVRAPVQEFAAPPQQTPASPPTLSYPQASSQVVSLTPVSRERLRQRTTAPAPRPSWQSSAPIDADIPLISGDGTKPERRPSDVSDLLSKMRVHSGPTADLYDGLKKLSQVDHSPPAPQVVSSEAANAPQHASSRS